MHIEAPLTFRHGHDALKDLERTIRYRFPAAYLFVLPLLVLLIASTPATAGRKRPEDRPMTIALVHSGKCTEVCVQWISAEGEFTSDTPKRLRAVLKRLKGRRLPVVFQSVGGNVDAAIAVGRMIRAAGLDTVIGRTQLDGCPMLDPRCTEMIVKNGWSVGEVRAGGAFCFSACPLALAGGKVRAAAANAYIGLHQITNGRKNAGYGPAGRRNLDAISTRSDPSLKRMLSAYYDEMGVNKDDVFAMMGLATPDGLYPVEAAEALSSRIITEALSVSVEPGYTVKALGPPTANGFAK